MPEGHAVTKDRARKKAIRARMAASGEPYSAAARKLDAASPVDDPAVTDEVVARADSTLAAPAARIEFRVDIALAERRRPGPLGRLASLAARATGLRDAFARQAGQGFLLPAAGRYQIDYGAYAAMRVDGRHFAGRPGQALQARHRDPGANDPLELLGRLRGATDVRHVRDETVRGTRCRVVAALAGPDELTAWIDDEHVRRIQAGERASDGRSGVSKRLTLELWDFGVPVDSLDWSRLPSFRAPG